MVRKTHKKFGTGTYCFRDVGTKEKLCVRARNPTGAAQKASKKLSNWEFISFKKKRKSN